MATLKIIKRELTIFSINKNYSIILKKYDRVEYNNIFKNTEEYSISDGGLFFKRK